MKVTTEGPPARRSFARFRPLVTPSAHTLAGTFDRMAEHLAGLGIRGRVQFVILDGKTRRCWALEGGPKGCKVTTRERERPALEVVTTADTWWQIAQGELSPIEAFGRGRLSVSGNLDLAERLVRHLAQDDGTATWLE